jgi:uridylate kinase
MGDMLQISYVGYISQEIKVESNKLLRIIMEEDTKKLEEVVVVGYGTQKKVNLTGAVSAVSAEDLASKPVMSTAQALAGLYCKLQVVPDKEQLLKFVELVHFQKLEQIHWF